jgi:CRISPR/Cas system CSM-associated protein Csm3 (group 7 of RAMP superfamily)
MSAHWQKPRGIQERIVVRGALVLETPTHLGNGDVEGPLDMPLLLDPLEGRALLTGTSIAGALRNYLRAQDATLAEILFGAVSDEENHQSPFVVDDALEKPGEKPKVELRDGVAIDPQTRTAEAKKKFDIELLEAGTEFHLSFELLVLKERADELRRAFALALKGLEKGEVRLGKRKRRGFGRCLVKEWCVHRYEVTTPAGMIAWLEGRLSSEQKGPDIAFLLGVPVEGQTHRPVCTLEGTFVVDGSLLIKSGLGEADAPDFVHLRSKRNGKEVPVLSGTSLAGALRARALRIANTLGKDGKQITDNLFGYRREKEEDQEKLTASKLWTEETVIENGLDLVHTRVKIDRFTGGSYPGALFSEQPVFGKLNAETTVKISVRLENPSDGEVGLLLLLLKDLWTGDLPLGGESGIGRGRLKGKQASLKYNGKIWTFIQGNRMLRVEGDRAKLESFVKAFTEGEI